MEWETTLLGILEFEKIRLKVESVDTYEGRFFRIHGDGCVFPLLSESHVNQLLFFLVKWMELEEI